MKKMPLKIFLILFLWSIYAVETYSQHSADLFKTQTDSILSNSDTLLQLQNDSTLVKKSGVLEYLMRKDSNDVYYHSFFDDSINYTVLKYIDTLNHKSGHYTPVDQINVFYNDLGVVGSAQNNQLFSPLEETGFHSGINAYNAYLWRPRDIRIYDNRSPYTRLLYVMGGEKENILNLAHSQKFLNEQLGASFKFQLYNQVGAYNHQNTDVKSFQGGLSYRVKNKRYSINTQYYHNKQTLSENGGLLNISDFEENRETNRKVFTTNLETGENLIRISGLALKQQYYLSKAEPDFSKIPDTNIIEHEGYSVTHFKKPYFDPVSHLGRILHYFNYERQNYRYTDQEQNSKIYEGIPYYATPDSTIFFDSIGLRKYENEIIYSNTDYKDKPNNPKFLNYFAGGRHEYIEYEQDSAKRYFQHFAVIGGVFINISNNLSLLSDVEYYIGDYLNNDFKFDAKLFFKLKSNVLTGGFRLNHRSADWIFQNYSTSRFTWDNDFDKVDIQLLYFKFERKNLKLFAHIRNITHYVFFNEVIVPEQTHNNIQHLMVKLEKNFVLKHWGSDLVLTYQSISHPSIIRVPEITGKAKFYYHNFFFENALDLEIGVEFYYFTKYMADKYMPAVRAFHLQNDQEIGDFLIADVYANIKLGKARLFVRYDHFNAGLMGYNYYASPDYPMQDASFKFGVNWILFD